MRKLTLITLIVLLSGPGMASVEPSITLEKVSPQPVQPGETAKMFIVIRNGGTSRATFDPVEVETPDGINFTGTTADFSDSFTLCGGCQTTGTLYFSVSQETVSGSYPVDVKVSREGAGTVGKFELVVDGSPKLLVETDRLRISPGQSSSTTLKITNIGTGKASQVTLQPKGSFEMTPSVLSLGTVQPGETVSRNVSFEIESDSESGLRSLELEMSYINDTREVTETASVKATVLEKARIAVSDFSVGNPVKGKKTSVTVQVENLGPGEAERIVSNLACEGAKVNSGKAFIGVLGEEESVPMVFSLTPTQGEVSCSIEVKFTDSSRQGFSESFGFSADSQDSIIIPVIAAIIVIGAAAYYWRKRREDELEEI